MSDIDVSQPDRDVGAMLSGAEVERLREAVNWMRRNRGLRLTDIARSCDAPEHTVRNFAYRKSNRPDNGFLGKLYKYFVSDGEFLPDELSCAVGDAGSRSSLDLPGRVAKYEVLRHEFPISEDDLMRVYDRYSGYYVCFRRSYRPAMISISWLHIRSLNPNFDISKEDLSLPRFTLFTNYRDRIDPETKRSYVILGYVLRRSGHLFLTGQNDGELKYVTLSEPTTRKFTYLPGICLLTSAEDKIPFSTRIICQYLGTDVARNTWEDKIGVFSDAEFSETFDNADIINRALGNGSVIVGSSPV